MGLAGCQNSTVDDCLFRPCSYEDIGQVVLGKALRNTSCFCGQHHFGCKLFEEASKQSSSMKIQAWLFAVSHSFLVKLLREQSHGDAILDMHVVLSSNSRGSCKKSKIIIQTVTLRNWVVSSFTRMKSSEKKQFCKGYSAI